MKLAFVLPSSRPLHFCCCSLCTQPHLLAAHRPPATATSRCSGRPLLTFADTPLPPTARHPPTLPAPPQPPHSDTTVRAATQKGHVSAEHATIADTFDAYKMRAGLDKRKLGEAANPTADTSLNVQEAVRAAAAGGDARVAAAVGREAAVIGAVDNGNLDSASHLAIGEVPEGAMSPGRKEAGELPPWVYPGA